MNIRITILDDHQLMIQGLAVLIGKIPEFTLSEKFTSPRVFLDWVSKSEVKPDLCLIDVEMKEMSGVIVARQLKRDYPQIKIVALTMHEEPFILNRMIAAGADGYLHKNIDIEKMTNAVKEIMDGTFVVSEIDSKKKIPNSQESKDPTSRELEIIKFTARGKTRKQIAEILFISPRTVDTHRNNIRRKLDLPTLADIIQYANNTGLI